MNNYKKHLISTGTTIKNALNILNDLSEDAIAFIVDDENQLIGSLTDGDVRRALIKDASLNQPVDDIIQSNPKYIRQFNFDVRKVVEYRKNNFRIIPVVDSKKRVIDIINFRIRKSYLPVDAVIMAGGKGTRLRPLTLKMPKPLLRVGNKPIMEHNLDRLISFGINNFWFSVNYLGEQIEEYFGDGRKQNINIEYIKESKPLGTAGALSKIDGFKHPYVLLTNSDILTNLDYEDFFLKFFEMDAEMALVTIPYKVDVPYAVLETKSNFIKSFKEKPTYTYYSNGGIYLMKREVVQRIPKGTFFDAPDLMQELINEGKKVYSYPLSGYWLDVGKPEDFEKAQEDIKQLKL